jgi:hypothetical protein
MSLRLLRASRGWQPRRVVLTEATIFFFKADSKHIIDLIPLFEVHCYD